MKKFISVLILFAFLSAAVFAEEDSIEGNLIEKAQTKSFEGNLIEKEQTQNFTVSFELDMTQNLLSATGPLGNDADTNANPSNRYPGRLNFFTENQNDMRQSEMYIRFDWEREFFDARLELVGNRLVNRRDRGLREGYSFLDLFDEFAIGDFWVRGDFDCINAVYGRLNTRGIMNDYRFDTDTWWDRRYTGAGNLGPYRFFGYQMPNFEYTEVNNHGAIHGYEHYMMVGGKFKNFGLELSGSRRVDSAAHNGNAVSLGARFSGAEIANLVNLELMYGLNGQDATSNFLGDENEFANIGPFADGRGRWEHRFGLYGGVDLLDGDLGISLGYSGAIEFYEKWEAKAESPNEKDLIRIGPFYNGIDLKAQYSGIEKLTITTAFNASFSNVKGGKFDDDKWYMGLDILSPGRLDENQEEGFFGLAAGLNVGYQLADKLDVGAQIKNSSQWTSYINDQTELTQMSNQFGVSLTARVKISPFFDVTGGLAAQYDYTIQEGVSPTVDYRGGDFYFGIPITFNVRF